MLIPIYSFSQETHTKSNEIGVNFSNLNNFGLRYKFGNGKTYYRMTTLLLGGSISNSKSDSYKNNGNSIGLGLGIGIEKRKSIIDKLGFLYGLDIDLSYSVSNNKSKSSDGSIMRTQQQWNISPGLSIVLGIYCKLSNDFSISAELAPSVSYNTSESNTKNPANNNFDTRSTSKNFQFGLSNSSASFTLAYTFGK